MKKSLTSFLFLLVFIVVFGSLLPVKAQTFTACTRDVKACPNGDYTVRVSPDCEFAPCSSTIPIRPSPTSDSSTTTNRAPCNTDSDCSTGEVCYKPPMEQCLPPLMCKPFQPASYCTLPKDIPEPKPAPPQGCFYQQVQCFQAPCDPVLICPSPGTKQSCTTDADCSKIEICYQPPMPDCPKGVSCIQALPPKYCLATFPHEPIIPDLCNKDSNGDISCPQLNPPAPNFCENGTIVPRDADECGCQQPPQCVIPSPSPNTEQHCNSNLDCSPSEFCYQPPMPDCPEGMACIQAFPPKYCTSKTNLTADLNNDGKINILDFTVLSAQFMQSNFTNGDINNDNKVDLKDFTIMMTEFSVI